MKANPGGNEQLTALAGILLIVFLAVEGATLLNRDPGGRSSTSATRPH